VNCRSAQQLISPYLDQQLTGAEMLAMQQHLGSCAACAKEYRQVREVRLLLRSLSMVAPGQPLETRITHQLAANTGPRWKFAAGAAPLWSVPETVSRPQRGRKLAGALALSCLALLMLAAPFAPSTGDAARAGAQREAGVMESYPAQGAVLPTPNVFAHLGGGAGANRSLVGALGEAPLTWSAPHESGGALSQGGASVTLSGWSTEPLDDAAVGGYAAGDAVLAEKSGR